MNGNFGKQMVKTPPLRWIEWVLSVFGLVGGVYLLSPLLDLSATLHGASPLVSALASSLGIYGLGLAIIVSSVLMIVGAVKNKDSIVSTGLFWTAMWRLYIFLVTMIAVGPLPISWMSNFMLLLICIILYVHHKVKLRVKSDASD